MAKKKEINSEETPSVWKLIIDTYKSIDTRQMKVFLIIGIIAVLGFGCYMAYSALTAFFG